MCKGVEEKRGASFCRRVLSEGVSFSSSFGAKTGSTSCELCGLQASLYCKADDAYLCGKCDKLVHEANFLALRHIRCFLCNSCQNLTRRYVIGVSLEFFLPATVSVEDLLNNGNSRRNCSRKQNSTPFSFL